VEKVWEAGRPEQSGCTREGDLFKYKEREGVEVAFDTLKNTLDFDKVYMQSREGVYGYFFIAFNSLLLYFKSMLREAGMLKRSRSRTCSSSSPRFSSSTSPQKDPLRNPETGRGFSAESWFEVFRPIP